MKKTLPQLWVQISASVKTTLLLLSLITFGSKVSFAQFGANTCMGAQTIKLNLASTNVSLLSGTPGTVGVRYKYSNANVGGTIAIDVIAELVALQYGTVYNNTRFTLEPDNIGNPPSGTGFGVDGNFQPSFIGTATTISNPNGTNENLFSTWKFTLVLNSNNNINVYAPIVAQVIDNDGGAGSATTPTIQESVTSITNPSSKTLSSTTNQTLVGNTSTGPTVNQAGIGVSPDYTAYFYYNNVNNFTLRFNHNIRIQNGTFNAPTSNFNRYSSMHVGCDYAGDVPFTLTTISGTVFNDANGLNGTPANTVDGTGTNVGGTLFATLFDNTTGNVLLTVPVNADGTYLFNGITPGNNYSVSISNVNVPVGQTTAPATTLPAGWVNTGENNSTAAGNDGTVNGIYNIGVVNTNTSNVNFGIEQRPTAGAGTNSAVNPGGTTQVTVPANTFTNTTASSDPTPGTVTSIRITSFPTGATTIVINGTSYTSATFPGGGVVVPTDANGNPTQTITVDPTASGATSVSIPFVAIDNAGVESSNTGTAVLNFTAIAIGGNVFNDANGLNGTPANTVDGTLYTAAGLNAVLVDNTTGLVVATTPVTGGTYNFTNLNSGNYSVQITTNTATVGATPPTVVPPTGYVNTGENNGAGAGSDGTPNGIINIGAVSTTQNQVNFGIEQRPTAGSGSNTVGNPGGTTQVTVPASTFTNITASGDIAPGTVTSIRITSFPTGATTIVINGTSYTSATFPGGGVVVPTDASGNPTQTITIDPAANGATSISIPFVAIDNAGVASSNTGTAVINFVTPTISGTVFNDANGLNGTPANTVDGTGTNAGGLNANLINALGNVVATVPVNADGTYNFTNVNAGNYTVQISTTAGTVGNPAPAVVLPAGYVATGENIGAGAGSDGTPNGISATITVNATNITNVNFGIEQRPTAGAGTNSAVNPGGTTQVTVPANTFTNTTASSDPTPGTVTSIRITSFPTGATTIVINGTSYTSATFPGGGVVVPTDANGNPTQTITVDPTASGATSVSIPFVAIDNAGVESSNTGTAVLNFTAIAIGGNVFNDANGLNGTPANTVDGTLYTAAGLNAVLVDNTTGLVVATTPVTGGTYNFTNLNSGNYSVQITTNTATVGATPPTVVPPTGYVNTGENNGAGAGSDGTPNGIINIGAVSTTQNQVNFGIEQRPTAGSGSNTVGNPGGTTQVTVPASTFTNITASGDIAPGTVTSIRITSFPTGATTIVINGTSYTSATFPGGGVVVPTDASGNPTQTITIDPAANGATSISIPFVAIDNAGVASSNTGTAVINFVTPTISGTVFNDANGLNGTPANTVDGTGTNAGGLNANLINALGNVVATVPVNADGTYNFTNVNAGNYTVQINTTAGTVGNPAPAVVLPAGYVATGENIGAGAGSDGTPNGISATITVNATNITNVNFGIDRTPTSNNQTYTIATPTANSFLTLNGTGAAGSPGPLTGSDPEDLPTAGSLSTRTIQITQLTNNGNELWYNGVKITLGADGINPPSLTNPFTISNYNPSLLQIRFTGIGSTSTSFNYRFVDAAGVPSTTAATYNVNWLTVLPVNLISFQASATAQGHNIKWVTAAEINLSRYELEYSLNGNTYKYITTVAARNASTQQTYSYFQAPNDGVATYYYRLKIVEADGSFTYSNVSIINEKRAVKVSVSPNPTVDVVRATGLVAGNQVTVFDATGKKVAQQLATNNTATISLVGKSTGIYYLIVTDKNGERIAEVSVIKK
ncbi:T9SS type A sorting domain-containing protein [Ferruginibacter yonginensis]|uniref:T9SS type A sorting domain-containing protein n=1 Tax=Ferruginibacter yonginensis TaxID=1310416 RepID=A0ABV8QRG5_9BACT